MLHWALWEILSPVPSSSRLPSPLPLHRNLRAMKEVECEMGGEKQYHQRRCCYQNIAVETKGERPSFLSVCR